MRIIEVICDTSQASQICRLASQAKVSDWWSSPLSNDRTLVKLLVNLEQSGKVLDTMQSATESKNCRIIIYKADDIQPAKKDKKEKVVSSRIAASRQEIYADIEKNARIDSTFIFLVILSTFVAAIGLIQGSETVIIGAMVIAPLLGPNLALSLATSLGDIGLMTKSLGTLSLGLAMAISLSYLVGFFSPIDVSEEITARTIVGLESMALAFASGAAAALSMTTGVSSVLVGVMVAVALLPPASTIGLMISIHDYNSALGAALLLAVNIVAVNLSTKLVFLFKGIQPRTEEERVKARSWKYASLLVWIALFFTLGAMIYWKTENLPSTGSDSLIINSAPLQQLFQRSEST